MRVFQVVRWRPGPNFQVVRWGPGPNFAAAGLMATLVACGGGAQESGSAEFPRRAGVPKLAQSVPTPPKGLVAARFATVSDVFGPYIERHDDGALVVWAAASQAGARSWSALPLTDRGEPKSQPVALGDAPQDVGLVALRSLGQGSPASFILLDTQATTSGERVEARGLGADGSLRWGPVNLASSPVRFLWVGCVSTAEGSLVFWAQKARDRERNEPAEIAVVALNGKGELAAQPQVLVSDACAWQAIKSGSGAALGVVRASKGRCDAGPVELSRLNELGKLQGAATVVSAVPSAEGDLDLTRVGDRSLLVWSDRRGVERRVYTAVVDDGGRVVVAPGPALPARGEQAVVALVPPHPQGKSAFVVWEDFAERPIGGRLLDIAPIGGEGRTSGKRARLEYATIDGRLPEFQATARGVAALTLAPVCGRGPTCIGDNRPTFVEFDDQLRVVASEPLNIEAREAKSVDLGWGLTCGKTSCYALSALGKFPTPLYVTQLERRSDYYRPAAAEVTAGPAPRMAESEAIAAGDPLSQISVADFGGQRLVGFITDFDPTTPWQRLKTPAPDGRLEPLRARIGLAPRATGEQEAPAGPVVDLSLRAHSLAGVVISPAEAQKGEALVGWAGLDNGVPQVFLTTVNKQGAKLNQRMLTRKPGDVSDISLSFVGDGWIVGWVDERHNDPEIYVAKVNRAVMKIGNEQRITNASGAAADLALAPLGASVLAVWADARDSQTPGTADIHGALLSAKDATRLTELKLFTTGAHSFAPALSPFGAGVMVAWLESKTEQTAAGVYIGVLDEQGKWQTQPALVPIDDGSPTALALDCNASVCHAVINVDLGGPTELRGFEIKLGAAMLPARLTSLGGASAASVAPVLLGNLVYYADLNADREGRLRRARIEWE